MRAQGKSVNLNGSTRGVKTGPTPDTTHVAESYGALAMLLTSGCNHMITTGVLKMCHELVSEVCAPNLLAEAYNVQPKLNERRSKQKPAYAE